MCSMGVSKFFVHETKSKYGRISIRILVHFVGDVCFSSFELPPPKVFTLDGYKLRYELRQSSSETCFFGVSDYPLHFSFFFSIIHFIHNIFRFSNTFLRKYVEPNREKFRLFSDRSLSITGSFLFLFYFYCPFAFYNSSTLTDVIYETPCTRL